MATMRKSNERQRNVFGSPGLRLLQLYTLLHSGRRAYSLTRLAGLFRCSRQSILRMVEQLQLVGNGQVRTWVQRGERFYQAVPEPAPACIALNPGSLSQLLLCRDMVRHLLPKPIQDEISASLGAVASVLGNSADGGTDLASHAVSLGKGTIDYTPCAAFLDQLQTAMEENRLCRIQYRSRSGRRPKTHIFAPGQLIAYREALYARGRVFPSEKARGPGETRTFAVHRICGVTMLKTCFDPQPCDDGIAAFGFHYDAPFQVRARFHGEAAVYVSERTWSPGQHLQPHRDGSVTLTFTSTSRREVIAWILGFGPDAELLEPEDLRGELRGMAEAIRKRYEANEPGSLPLEDRGE